MRRCLTLPCGMWSRGPAVAVQSSMVHPLALTFKIKFTFQVLYFSVEASSSYEVTLALK